jgi:putative PIG3 family NAD(P)H quinone oxidoreductase
VRALSVVEHDGRYEVRLDASADPVPGSGEVLVRVAASGVNRADLSQIAGRYPPPPGESEILGLEVSGWRVDTGEAVCALLGGGGHAEFVAVPVGQIFPAPPGLDLVSAAGIPEAYLTAFVNLVVEAGLEDGQTVLIHAGASGVGQAAIRLAKVLGARVVATTRTAAKVPGLLAAGADLAIDTGHTALVAAIERSEGENAVHVVLDPIGAASLADDLQLLAPGGRVVCIATMGGAHADLDIRLLMRKRARLVGSTLRARSRVEKALLVERFRIEVLPEFETGRLQVVVDTVVPPARAAEAFQRMRDNQNVGKLLIDWTGRSGLS